MKEQIEALKAEVQKVAAAGGTIQPEALVAALDATLQHRMNHPWNIAMSTEMFNASISTAENAIKAVMLVSGGACAGLLAFMGHLLTSSKADAVTPGLFLRSTDALACFGIAFMLGAVCAGTRYVSQSLFATELMHRMHSREADGNNARKRAILFRKVALTAMLMTAPFLVLGGYLAYSGLRAQYQEGNVAAKIKPAAPITLPAASTK